MTFAQLSHPLRRWCSCSSYTPRAGFLLVCRQMPHGFWLWRECVYSLTAVSLTQRWHCINILLEAKSHESFALLYDHGLKNMQRNRQTHFNHPVKTHGYSVNGILFFYSSFIFQYCVIIYFSLFNMHTRKLFLSKSMWNALKFMSTVAVSEKETNSSS